MSRVDITLSISLPEELLKQAQSAGLLSQEEIERWLKEELERQSRLDTFFSKLDRLAEIKPAITEAQIDEEIENYRNEKRKSKKP